tara:strand:+ start:41657 stop:42784 length:1128 start_codon:yes stop_codon:yes gene_type:complete
MKIVLTGGGTGGHFYPIISVAKSIREISKELKLLEPKIYFFGPEPYDERALFDNSIIFKRNTAGKKRIYFSPRNFVDIFKTGWGILTALWKIFLIFPDIVFAKGGYASFPVLVAAKFFRIPVIIHESDSVPGRVNLWAGKFAKRIAISFPEVADKFPKGKVALTGNPIRKELVNPSPEGAREYLNLETSAPTILILGGSQGAQAINDVILSSLNDLVEKYQIIHQTGKKNIEYVNSTAQVVLSQNKLKSRYRAFDYLNVLAMKMSAGVADIVISRAGSSIFEIASWGIPSILIPIPENISRDQRSNAFAYSSTGAAVVIEEKNLSSHLLLSEIDRILSNENTRNIMSEAAKKFAQNDAGKRIAKEILNISLEHEI